jgi:aminopeptidase N
MKKLYPFIFVLSFFFSSAVFAESGGPLHPLQAAYDVKYYHLDLNIDPDAKNIDGSLLSIVEIVNPIDTLLFDLDFRFAVDSVHLINQDGSAEALVFNHSVKQLFIFMTEQVQEGELIKTEIFYHGAPRIAPGPPWNGGFVWDQDAQGNPWIGVACEFEGADLWWPCKDHPSDEPDSVSISLTVPDPLFAASNGRYLGNASNGDGTSTYDWFVSTPINNYNITFYIAEFALIEDTYIGIHGDTIPFYFWVLPEDSVKAANHMGVFKQEFDFLESICGPFPFTGDKHGWGHAPYWGMEHQTIIAYGHDFSVNNWGFDYIHYHELAHEWYGNLLTCENWADVWIHEGIATYTEALYVEHLSGIEQYHAYMGNPPSEDIHEYPLAPFEDLTAGEGLSDLNPYWRGKWVMHTLRYHLGDEDLFKVMERWNYPDSTDYDNTNGRLCRLLNTDDMKEIAEEHTDRELDPFFDVFFRETLYPFLHIVQHSEESVFTWVTENNVPLDLNVPVLVNGEEMTVEMNDGQGSIAIANTDELIVDPDEWILMENPSIVTSVGETASNLTGFQLKQNFPNPFAGNTTLAFVTPDESKVTISVYDIYGKKTNIVVDQYYGPGNHRVHFNGSHLKPGLYLCEMDTGGQSLSIKMSVR